MTDRIIELDSCELAVRIAEAMFGMKRPTGAKAEQALSALAPERSATLMRAADASIQYFEAAFDSAKAAQ